MVNKSSKKYAEYVLLVQDLLDAPAVRRLDWCRHHYGVSRMRHSINVSYYSFIICKKLHMDYRAVARAGLLHDLFHYECSKKKFGILRHAAIHPKLALRNAERLTKLSELEKDIIVKHMWLCGKAIPRYPESYVVSLVDKYSAVYEILYSIWKKLCSKHTIQTQGY
ncbi:HD domain-containing protein [Ructibacterium gallinarum]|uniref:HD domain-containing protein n=1 Tax=Ructibacterium gallinarum TaxID=2779355 RepID=A0A9D5RBD3_9FIRM|nr:HD domain-containing protein [Ructibacterium gallinarum]MBE5039913.1 HD domain-containing protein [Ructibacterium gallinarum]